MLVPVHAFGTVAALQATYGRNGDVKVLHGIRAIPQPELAILQ